MDAAEDVGANIGRLGDDVTSGTDIKLDDDEDVGKKADLLDPVVAINKLPPAVVVFWFDVIIGISSEQLVVMTPDDD